VPAKVHFSLAAPAAQAVAVAYHLGGLADSADLVERDGTVTIPAGAMSADLTLTPVNDTRVEGFETVVVSALVGERYAVDGAHGDVTITLVDDDNVVLDGLRVYYLFDETQGTTVHDYSGGGWDAAFVTEWSGYPFMLPQWQPTGGAVDGALTFPLGW